MKAVQFRQCGEPSTVLSVGNLERPKPGNGEVLVRMLATPINPSDLMFIRGRYTVPAQCPATPGFEGVGVVEENGGGLRGRLFLKKNVVVLNRRGGNWADYAVVPATEVIPVSRQLSVEQAATFFVNPATAWVMTQEVLKVPKNQWLVQSAAGSALGRMIIRLGKTVGFKTFNIVRREAQAEELRRLGADFVQVFDENNDSPEQLVASIKDNSCSDGVRYAIDAVGGKTGSAIVASLGQNGSMLAYGTLSNEPLVFSPRTLMTKGSRIEGFWLGSFMANASLVFKLRLVRRLTKLIQSGVLSTEIARSYTLDEISDAVKASENSAITGKSLLKFPG